MQHKFVREVNDLSYKDEIDGTDKLVLIDFGAEWCGPCKIIAPILEDLAEKNQDWLRVLKVDVGESPVAAQEFGIRAIPTIAALQNGHPLKALTGGASRKKIETFLNEVRELAKAYKPAAPAPSVPAAPGAPKP